jgi:putative sigma-54 modulation protein
MKIHLTPRHLRLSPALEQQTVEKLGALEELNTRLLTAHVVLSHDDTADPANRFTARARLEVAGPDLHAEEHASDLYAAIDGVADKLARQLRKRKTKLTDYRRTRRQRAALAT